VQTVDSVSFIDALGAEATNVGACPCAPLVSPLVFLRDQTKRFPPVEGHVGQLFGVDAGDVAEASDGVGAGVSDY